MKQAVKFGSGAPAIVWTPWLAVLSGPLAGIACCRAAQRDERNGYPLTAAMEWRKAAQFVALIPAASEFCWKQWERLMQLPRRLAEPIGTGSYADLSRHTSFQPAVATISPTNQVPLASAA